MRAAPTSHLHLEDSIIESTECLEPGFRVQGLGSEMPSRGRNTFYALRFGWSSHAQIRVQVFLMQPGPHVGLRRWRT